MKIFQTRLPRQIEVVIEKNISYDTHVACKEKKEVNQQTNNWHTQDNQILPHLQSRKKKKRTRRAKKSQLATFEVPTWFGLLAAKPR